MIKTREDLKQYILEDNCGYQLKNRGSFYLRFVREEFFWIDKYLRLLRKEEYYTNNIINNRFNIIIAAIYTRRKNKIGRKVNVSISPNCAGKGLTIYHPGVIINSGAIIGDYCSFHGNNCVGNNGKDHSVPVLGNHIELGYSACIFGGVTIADSTFVGAGAIVIKSSTTPGKTLVGVPAKAI